MWLNEWISLFQIDIVIDMNIEQRIWRLKELPILWTRSWWITNSKHEHFFGWGHGEYRTVNMNIEREEIMVKIKHQTWTFLWTRSWWTSVAWSSPLQLPCLSQQPTNRWEEKDKGKGQRQRQRKKTKTKEKDKAQRQNMSQQPTNRWRTSLRKTRKFSDVWCLLRAMCDLQHCIGLSENPKSGCLLQISWLTPKEPVTGLTKKTNFSYKWFCSSCNRWPRPSQI